MTYEEFIEQYKMRVHEEFGCNLESIKLYPEGFTSDEPIIVEWINDSNQRYAGKEDTTLLLDILQIEMPEVYFIHRVAIRQSYEDGLRNGFEEVFKEIRDIHNEMKGMSVDEFRLEARLIGDYEKIRKQLILRPLNYKIHIRDLQGCVYRKINDFVLCLYQVIADKEHDLTTSKIRKIELERWGVEEDKAMHDALENTAYLYPPCVYDRRTHKEENFLEREFTREDITFSAPHKDLITLSTFRTTNGAVALFYPGVIEKMMKIMGGPFQAVFMNTNDILIFDKNDKTAYSFAETARSGSTGMGEMLSGKIYLCDGKNMIPGIIVKVYSDGEVVVE